MGGSEDLSLAREAIRSGDRDAARRHLCRAIRADPQNETAWLWLSRVIDDPDKEHECLERALQIDPDHQFERDNVAKRRERAIVVIPMDGKAPPKARWRAVRHPSRVLALGVFLVLVCVGVLAMIGRGGGEDIATAEEVHFRCEEYVRAKLVAPSTAQFSASSDTAIGRTGDPGQTWIVAGHVDSQNKFGAMLRMRYVCKVEYRSEGEWALVELYVQEP